MHFNIQILNQLYEIQHKIDDLKITANFERNFNRIYSLFKDEGYMIQDPTNEVYNESRTDCEASIIGDPSQRMKISKTIKPIIYRSVDGNIQLVQKAVVLVEKN